WKNYRERESAYETTTTRALERDCRDQCRDARQNGGRRHNAFRTRRPSDNDAASQWRAGKRQTVTAITEPVPCPSRPILRSAVDAGEAAAMGKPGSNQEGTRPWLSSREATFSTCSKGPTVAMTSTHTAEQTQFGPGQAMTISNPVQATTPSMAATATTPYPTLTTWLSRTWGTSPSLRISLTLSQEFMSTWRPERRQCGSPTTIRKRTAGQGPLLKPPAGTPTGGTNTRPITFTASRMPLARTTTMFSRVMTIRTGFMVTAVPTSS